MLNDQMVLIEIESFRALIRPEAFFSCFASIKREGLLKLFQEGSGALYSNSKSGSWISALHARQSSIFKLDTIWCLVFSSRFFNLPRSNSAVGYLYGVDLSLLIM
jgi:hypothetical protein